jgi:hypothetical protein
MLIYWEKHEYTVPYRKSIKKNTEPLLVAIKEGDLEVNSKKSKYKNEG